MAFGFETGRGWHPLIRELINKLQDIADSGYDFQITQVKEKWGTLCVYVDHGPEEVFDLIQEYVQKSTKICEVCGRPGSLYDVNCWYMTRCDICLAAEMAKKNTALNKFKDATAIDIFGRTKAEALENFTCVWCDERQSLHSFRDQKSEKEYTITGMCQACQDKIYD